MPYRIALATAAVFALAACGGGGSGSGPKMTTEIIPPAPPVPPQSDPARYAIETGGPTAAEVLDFLGVFASGGPWHPGDYTGRPGLSFFREPPTLRIAEGTSDHQRALILHGVAMVNRARSYERHIRIGPDAPALTPIADIPEGQIFVDFAPRDDWDSSDPNFNATTSTFIGLAQHRYETRDGERSPTGRTKARIYMLDTLPLADRHTMDTMVHELLHTLGFTGHPDPDEYLDSYLQFGAKPKATQLGQLDIAAMRAAGKIAVGLNSAAVQPEDLTAENLGPWETDAVTLSDTLAGMSWGVRHRNGLSVPWTDGRDPTTTLANNRSLSGTATWGGELLGFTPELAPVAGKAGIGVDLATMDGRADFTELQSWAAGSGPGALGTGLRWNTGALGYTITVGGNYLRSTGGDAGAVHGRFYGGSHEGVAGTVERSDLTAAFGARR